MKIFEKLNKKIFGTNCHLTTRSKIVNNKLSSLLIKRPLENFHEIFGLSQLPVCFSKKNRKFGCAYRADFYGPTALLSQSVTDHGRETRQEKS
jgi:hypothetical protein